MSTTLRQQGFGLVEVMVGLVVAMVTVLAVMQAMNQAEAARRVTVGGDDAQLNASMALHLLGRELRRAGHGINGFEVLGCSLSYTTSEDGQAITLAQLAPVTLNADQVAAGDSHTDTLLLVTGNAAGPAEGDATTATTTSSTYTITTASNFVAGDYVVVADASRSSSCALKLAQVTAVSGQVLTVSNGDAGHASGSLVFNLGASPRIQAYAVRNGDLTVCDFLAYDCSSTSTASTGSSTVWVPLASQVVSLRAQYAKDTTSSAMDGVADQFDTYSPGDSDDNLSAYALQCRWARILGVRLAVVGRSVPYDRSAPSEGVSTLTWSGGTVDTGNVPSNPVALAVDLSGLSDRAYHRYRLMETVVPLRNIIWQGNQATFQGGSSGC